jgi:glycosyltransferase involved in cell wall biosynthesis
MRVVLFAPNGGASLSTGGGTNLVLKLADSILRQYRAEVVLAGYHALPAEELERLHGIPLRGRPVSVVAGGGAALYRGFRRSPIKLSAYDALFTTGFALWARATLDKWRPDVVGFNDDVPVVAQSVLSRRRAFLYVHYPLAARTARLAPPLARTRGWIEKGNDRWLIAHAGRIVVRDPGEICSPVLVNSQVTERAARAVWPTARPHRLYTYAEGAVERSDPRNSAEILAVGTISRGKGFDDLLEGVARVRSPAIRLRIVGHARDAAYASRLRRRARRSDLAGRVTVETDLSPEALARRRAAAGLVAQPAEFEPFGLALLEGMRGGAYPLVRRSEFSGAWTDILERGRYGAGFEGPDDLAPLLDRLTNASPSVDVALRRASEFSRDRFDEGVRATGLFGP